MKKAPDVRLAITVALKGYVPQPPTYLAHGIEVLEWLAEPILDGLGAAAEAAQRGLAATLSRVERVTDEAAAMARSAVQDLESMLTIAQERMKGLRKRALDLQAEIAAKSAAAAHKAVRTTAHVAEKGVEKTAARAAAVGHAFIDGWQVLARQSKHMRKATRMLTAGQEKVTHNAEALAHKSIDVTAKVASVAIVELQAAHAEVLQQLSKLEEEISDLEKKLAAAGAYSIDLAQQLADKVDVIERAVTLANTTAAELAAAQQDLRAFLANPAAALAKHLSIERVYDIISSSLPSAERLRARLMEGGLGTDIYMEDPDKSRGGPGGK